jgi:hypothetical protein
MLGVLAGTAWVVMFLRTTQDKHTDLGEIADKRRLEVIPPPRVVPDHNCSGCKHYDLVAGQEALHGHAAFASAMRHRSPAQMYNTTDNPNRVPPLARWADFGACAHHVQIVYKTHVCENYEAKE